METAIYLIGFLLLIALIIAVVSSGDPVPSPTEEAADEIMDELLANEAPEPPPADLFVREEDLKEATPEPVVEKTPVVKIINPTPKVEKHVEDSNPKPAKKKKHYPSKPKNKKP